MELYMGMPGHAAFIRTTRTVFAHDAFLSGSVPMAALEFGQSSAPMDPQHAAIIGSMACRPEVVFPYGFPTPGNYRVIVQMKHGE